MTKKLLIATFIELRTINIFNYSDSDKKIISKIIEKSLFSDIFDLRTLKKY
jgi:hypothetical protein